MGEVRSYKLECLAVSRSRVAPTLPFMSAPPGPLKGLPGVQGAVRQLADQSAHTYKPMYAAPAIANRYFAIGRMLQVV